MSIVWEIVCWQLLFSTSKLLLTLTTRQGVYQWTYQKAPEIVYLQSKSYNTWDLNKRHSFIDPFSKISICYYLARGINMLVKRKKVPTDDRFLSVFFVITRTFLLSILNFSTGTHKSSHMCHGILAMNQSTNKSRSIMRTTDFLPVKQVKLKQLLHGTSFHV